MKRSHTTNNPIGTTIRLLREIILIIKAPATKSFLAQTYPSITFFQKIRFIIHCVYISASIECTHTNEEIITIAQTIVSLPSSLEGVIVEAGVYKGGSAAKLSLVTNIVGRKLVLLDSFEGIPTNNEIHTTLTSRAPSVFMKGAYSGGIKEVKRNIQLYGKSDVCLFVKGWFQSTLRSFHMPIAVAFLDVTLASSTRTCLKYLYPLLQPKGTLFCHDGHLALIVELLKDTQFWEQEVGHPQPKIKGIGKQKLLKIKK